MPRYHLKTLIGVGTFAEVWRAERLDQDGTACASDVALKISLCPATDDRAQRERAVLYQTAPLQHPGTIRVLDITVRDDRLAIAMEIAEDSLLRMLQEGLSAVECIRHVAEVASTLDDLHGRGVLHCGINPSDILIVAGRARVTDFGPLPCDTATSAIPYYKALCMPPELRRHAPRPESDQYALAATYAWLRLSHPPFGTLRGPDLAWRIDLGVLPKSEQQVLLRAMNPDPTARFASCGAFAEALAQKG
jgi:serine/threonine-protein kinase